MCTHLWLVLGLHVRRSQDLRVYALREAGVDVLPGRPNRKTKGEGTRDAEHRVPNDPPQESIEEEEDEIHEIHNCEGKCGLISTECITKELVVASSDLHVDHDPNRVTEALCEEKVRLCELATEYKNPEKYRGNTSRRL